VKLRRTNQPRTRRRGAATVEMAICLPMLTILVFGSIAAANAIYMKQIVVTAAYEAAREATKHGGTQAKAKARAESVLAGRSIDNSSVTFSPDPLTGAGRGENVSITVSASIAESFPVPLPYFDGIVLESTTTMVKQ